MNNKMFIPNYKIVTTHDDLQKVFAVRAIVFVEEQKVSYEEEIDGCDFSSVHFLATVGNEPIGAARLLLFNEYVKIGRLAVRKSYRGQGIGKELFAFVLDYVAKIKYQKVTLHAQAYLIRFYEDFGFVKRGEMFLEAGIEHYYMEKIVTKE
ncbi:MAG: GNAT family N-acetyltransferase [Dysgonamonadaceae bacterium]|jgi:predicted GNAT family N-acyltransferase|nr:GNAT family N-acetyltransferase [Dysgonamonadaceae bacterium]